jgi:hypothetical protein
MGTLHLNLLLLQFQLPTLKTNNVLMLFCLYGNKLLIPGYPSRVFQISLAAFIYVHLLQANSEPMDEDEADEAFLLADLVASRPSGRFPLEVPTEGEF